ncbi:MAG: thiamine pyrophosphate-dependent dehydrogenase E1 component subunit alpha [Myxococcota bacterium]
MIDPARSADLGAGLASPPPDEARAIGRALLRSRRLDLRIAALTRAGRVKGAYYSSVGNEATSVGCALALDAARDVLLPTHRDLGAHLVFGHTPRDVLLQYFKRRASHTGGRDVGLHLGKPGGRIVAMVSHIGHMMPVAAGVALAEQRKGTGGVALTTIGDGGTSTGDFHEALNFAAVRRLPVVFVIENNQYAYSTPTEQQYACARLADRAAGYGIAGEQVDGTDVFLVRDATARGVARARAGEGPSLLECVTMRLRGHSEHDDASYVPRETLVAWEALDPIARMEAYLSTRELADAGALAEIEAEIDEAVEWAEAQEPAAAEDAASRVYQAWDPSWRPGGLR